MNRAQYVQALRTERAALNNRIDTPVKKRRIADVEAELARYENQPDDAPLEIAAGAKAPRTRRARKPRAAKVEASEEPSTEPATGGEDEPGAGD